MGTHYIFTFELKPGMITADDVYSITGLLIVPKNTVITNDTISILKMNNITDVKISDEPAAADTSSMTYNERLTASPRYQDFRNNFIKNIESFKENMNEVITRHAPINTEELNEKCTELFNKTGPGLELFTILDTMKKNDDSTYTHCLNVALISAMLGRWLHFSESDIDALMLSGMLHDIGKLTIPDDVLKKPGKLTDAEYDIIKKHSVGGYNILKDQKVDTRVKEACLLHHERCDGKGYPFGLKSEKIPAFAKIVSIADVYDAMTAKRCYHAPMCPFKVIRILQDEAYAKYDPMFINTFLSNVVDTYINTTVRLTDGRTGQLVMINRNNYSRPVVKCGSEFIDLSNAGGIDIESII